jgi:adenylate kinase
VVALGASAILIVLGLASQHVAVRSGAVGRDRRRDIELRAEIAGWSDWKKVAYLAIALAAGVVVIVLRIWYYNLPSG